MWKYYSLAGLIAFAVSSARAALLYNPVVTQVGDGVNPITNAGATTTIQIYAAGVANQPTPMSQVAYGNGVLVNTGNAISEGILANNPGVADAATAGLPYGGAEYVYSAGYAANDGTPDVNGSAANRVVGDVNVTGEIATSPTILASQTENTAYTATGNIRAGVGDDAATNVWSAGTSVLGGTAGYRYFNNNTQLESSTGPTNTRTIQIRHGQLYGSSDTSSFVGISLIGLGTPQTGGQTVTPLFSTGTSTVASPEQFALIDDPNVATPTVNGVNVPFNVAYIADANAGSSTSQPGIQKWVYSPTITTNNGWSLAYVISDSVTGAPDGYVGLAAEMTQIPVISSFGGLTEPGIALFATNLTNTPNGGNSLEEFIDPLEGGTAAGTDATMIALANAPADDEFRGVALTSVPEPGTLGLLGVAGLGLTLRRRGDSMRGAAHRR
jgi:hypothetical protein